MMTINGPTWYSINTARMTTPVMMVDSADELALVMGAAGSLANLATLQTSCCSHQQAAPAAAAAASSSTTTSFATAAAGKKASAVPIATKEEPKAPPSTPPPPTTTTTQKKKKQAPAKQGLYRRQSVVKHKRRYCRQEGCTRIVKAQGLCQRHGAQTRTCKVPSCDKQAQGSFEGMCKAHYRAQQQAQGCAPKQQQQQKAKEVQPAAAAAAATVTARALQQRRARVERSVFEKILPESILGWQDEGPQQQRLVASTSSSGESSAAAAASDDEEDSKTAAAQITDGSSSSSDREEKNHQAAPTTTHSVVADAAAPPAQSLPVMPLIEHLRQGFEAQKPIGWHRNDERRARGLGEVTNPRLQLESWERQLVWMEILLLSGTFHAHAQSSFIHLARAWGRDKGFHTVLSNYICQRRGQVERKAKTLSPPPQPRAPTKGQQR